MVRDTERLTAALRELLADAGSRERLHDKVTIFVEHNDAVLGRWAAVMLNADVYAEVIDRHVELPGELAWMSSLLGFEPAEDDERTRMGRSHPAAMIEGPLDDERLVQRLAAITHLAEQLDRGALTLALRIVPIDWWREQLGASAPSPLGAAPNAWNDKVEVRVAGARIRIADGGRRSGARAARPEQRGRRDLRVGP